MVRVAVKNVVRTENSMRNRKVGWQEDMDLLNRYQPIEGCLSFVGCVQAKISKRSLWLPIDAIDAIVPIVVGRDCVDSRGSRTRERR